MAMSRRFYRNLAAKFKANKPTHEAGLSASEYELMVSVWAAMVLSVMSVIEEEAPSFDKVRFAEAAGIPLSASA